MQQKDKILFEQLKKEIVASMQLLYPGINTEVREWKGQEIFDFQEDLLEKVNGRISEKWFYTHMKGEPAALPRIDVLNMLSKYAGYSNWGDFAYRHISLLPIEPVLQKPPSSNSVFWKIPAAMLIIMLILVALFQLIAIQTYRFTFVDADTGEPVKDSIMWMEVLQQGEPPLVLRGSPSAGILLKTDKSRVSLVPHVPYYIKDTAHCTLKKFNRRVQVVLRADVYALMIHYFSTGDVAAWQKRREKLEQILSEDAVIYQLPDDSSGNVMELYNKQEFIDKLTVPSSALRQIEILDTRYDRGQIAILRFRTKAGTL